MNQPFRNRLAQEKSPYLLQHASNPVDWYPWGEEAFEKARLENKPVFLSIGYSTCHWCHVMAHESFEDAGIARAMNDVFVSIKVDREERPDLDSFYMTVCQMLTGSGGWPLTIIMTPDKQPFFAGTYFPKTTAFGRVGLTDLIPQIGEIWKDKHDEIVNSAAGITEALRTSLEITPGKEIGQPELSLAYEQLSAAFDERNGGFGSAPKFPSAHNLFFLLRWWKRSGDAKALQMVEKTLRALRCGGIFDQIGFGFHRYSTDSKWLVPHFEKMLYDQALLAMAYIETFQSTGNPEYAATARQIFTYVLRDMKSPEGGFFSAEDADSEHVEGKFYLWTPDEINQVLGSAEAELFSKVFNIKNEGNFDVERQGENIPHLSGSLEEIAIELREPVSEIKKRLESSRQKLFQRREARIHPQKDDKILTDWNGLMIAALARAAWILDEPGYAAAAGNAADFILGNLITPDRRLLHRFRDGEAAVPGQICDYAYFIWGLLELYEATFEPRYLEAALEFNGQMIKYFRDEKNGGFYNTALDTETLPVRQKEIYDGALPSGNSVIMLNLLRLARLSANTSLEEEAARISRAFFSAVQNSPSSFTQLLTAIDFAIGTSFEIVIAGEPTKADTREMLNTIRTQFMPGNVLIVIKPDSDRALLERLAPYTAQMTGVNGKSTAYVCRNNSCNLPTTDPAEMLRLLGG